MQPALLEGLALRSTYFQAAASAGSAFPSGVRLVCRKSFLT